MKAGTKTVNHSLGDGDPCPLDPDGHGKMYVSKDRSTQRCIHQSHDGRPASGDRERIDPTRASWPLGSDALAREVAAYRAAHPEKVAQLGA